jgi:hypothetical protein
MGVPRTLGSVSVGALPPTPVYTGTVIAAVSFVIKKGVATVSLGAGNMPANGYNGPNPNIQGYPNLPANGQQVTLWGWTTATYFNGLTVTVTTNNIATGQFSFNFNHADVSLTSDTGNTAAIPVERYRAVRIECMQNLGTDFIYVGDGSVSSSRYVAALSLGGQLAVEVTGDNIPAERIFITGTSSGDSAQISLVY